MGKALKQDQIESYRQRGFVFPLPAFSASDAGIFRTKLEELEAQNNGRLPAGINRKPHLLLTWLNELIRDARILDAVEDIIGPNILCWGSGFFIKIAATGALVS